MATNGWTAIATALAVALSGIACASADEPAPQTTAATVGAQKTFDSPQAAANALVAAAGRDDVPALLAILGPSGADLVETSDRVQDERRAKAFAAKAREKSRVVMDSPSRATLVVGDRDWPVPIPIVATNGVWRFDTAAGRQEILNRRIGANELDAITVCRGYVEAQETYASTIHDDSGVHQFARRIVSTPGTHDGLAWRNPDGTWGGPIGENVAKAISQGYSKRSEPFHGYYFKVLEGQGPAAALGKLDYVVGGAMIGGFALVAWPAQYRVTGVDTFIVSYDGVVYQKDLGPDTAAIASRMTLYNPDATWQRTNDEWSL